MVWIVLISVFLVLPPSELVLWTTVLICIGMFLWWQIDAKRRFHGPTKADEAALRAMEEKVGETHIAAKA